jgi:hypothetical protein
MNSIKELETKECHLTIPRIQRPVCLDKCRVDMWKATLRSVSKVVGMLACER